MPRNESDDVRVSDAKQQNNDDKLRQEYESNPIEISNIQRLVLSVGSSVAALFNPHRYGSLTAAIVFFFQSGIDYNIFHSRKYSHDMIACLGETTGIKALHRTLDMMKASDEGTQILLDKPRINTTTVDIDALGCMPIDTLGFYYKKFLDDNVSEAADNTILILCKSIVVSSCAESNAGLTNASKIHKRSGINVCDDTIS